MASFESLQAFHLVIALISRRRDWMNPLFHCFLEAFFLFSVKFLVLRFCDLKLSVKFAFLLLNSKALLSFSEENYSSHDEAPQSRKEKQIAKRIGKR